MLKIRCRRLGLRTGKMFHKKHFEKISREALGVRSFFSNFIHN